MDTIRPTRRTLVRGAAWSVPVISVAAVAPAFAASLRKDPGINGWVNVQYGTDRDFDSSFDSDPSGTDPATPDGAPFGLYLYDVNVGPGNTIADTIAGASMTLWFRGTVDSWDEETGSNIANGGGHGNGWSTPVFVGAQVKPDGLTYQGYRFDYAGVFALGDANTRAYLQDFGIAARSVNSSDATFWVERRIIVNGIAQTFQRRNGERGPIGNGFPSSSRTGRAAVTRTVMA